MPTKPSNFSRLQQLLPELFEFNKLRGNSYMSSQLTKEINIFLSMDSIQESLLVAEEQITPIAQMPNYFIGLMSSRDRVFGLIDLAQFLGLNYTTPLSRNYHTVVVRTSNSALPEQEQLIGLVFQRVQGVTRVMPEQIQIPQVDLSEKLSALNPHIKEYVNETGQQQPQSFIPILDIDSLVATL